MSVIVGENRQPSYAKEIMAFIGLDTEDVLDVRESLCRDEGGGL